MTPAYRDSAATADPAVKLWPRAVPDDHESVTPRRRRLKPLRRRRLLRWLKASVWTLFIVGSPVAAVLWIYQSPRFALENVEIAISGAEPGALGEQSAGRVPEAWVRETVEPFVGTNLLRLSLGEVSGRLETHPWVKSVSVTKELPSDLGLRIVERRAAAVWRDGGDLFYLDGAGEVIAPVEGDPPSGLVVVELAGPWHRPQPALDLLKELETAAPDWLRGLEKIMVLEKDDFVLSTTELPFPLLVRAGTVAGKVRYLRELLPDIMARTGAGAAIDLRFDRRIIIQPSAGSVAGVLAQRTAGISSGRNS